MRGNLQRSSSVPRGPTKVQPFDFATDKRIRAYLRAISQQAIELDVDHAGPETPKPPAEQFVPLVNQISNFFEVQSLLLRCSQPVNSRAV